ncbi:hypothetical protein [Actinoplanes sp. GCM10030250]|uniref:hypothetical protein n=1 Tax=Actinoplanes sp. GCM10030250 TaxID=3273376 RepID=UPI0036244436
MTSASTEAALLEQIHSTLTRIDGKTVELQRAIDGKLKWLPGPIQDGVVTGWNTFCEVMRRMWDNLNTMLSSMGSPSKLWTTADAWSDHVGVPVSGQVQTAEAGLLLTDDNWDGDAADAYRQMLPLQKAALDKIKSAITDGLSTALREVAQAIVIFWGALAAAFVALAIGLTGALGSSATIVGLPAAPIIAGGAAIAACTSMIIGAENLKSICASANSTLRQKFDDSAFHGGHWPPAVKG